MEKKKTRITAEQEETLDVLSYADFCNAVDTLVAEGVDLSSPGESGFTPMEYVMRPVLDQYGSIDDLSDLRKRLEYLLSKRTNPNVNTYRTGDDLPDIAVQSIRSSLLYRVIEGVRNWPCDGRDIIECEEELDVWYEIEDLLVGAGARVWKPCYNPWEQKSEEGYVVEMWPTQRGTMLFVNNAGFKTGDADSITVESEDGQTTKIDISGVGGLKVWHEEYKANCKDLAYDWQSWKERGLALAKTLAASLPSSITLFFPNFYQPILAYTEPFMSMRTSQLTILCTDGHPIRISQ